MSVQPALVVETIEATEVLEGVAPKPARRRFGHGAGQLDRAPSSSSLCALTVLVPLYVTVTMAFKTHRAGRRRQRVLAARPVQRRRLRRTRGSSPTSRSRFAISVLVTAGTVVGTVLLAAFASFAIVRNWDHKLFRWSFFYLLAAMFIPFPVLALPQIQLTGLVGLANPVGVTILHIMFQLSFSVLLFTAFLRSIPFELEESARIDGATHVAGVLAADLPAAGADERDGRHLRVPRLVERLHDAVADHRRPRAADPAGACRASSRRSSATTTTCRSRRT